LYARFLALRQLGLILGGGLGQNGAHGQKTGKDQKSSETNHQTPSGLNLMKYRQLRKGVAHEKLKLWQQNNTFRYYSTT
jgi:hypothetical protein